MRKFQRGEAGVYMTVFILVMILNAVIGGWLWPYTINTWLEFFGKAPVIVWWQGALIGFVPWISHATIPAAVVTWVLMLFLI